jgi:hypothetical protein
LRGGAVLAGVVKRQYARASQTGVINDRFAKVGN